ncbi:thioesterase family protein [Paenibacillus sp. CF384]|uniref:acyl-CoA thioesterase n=1 Tax=Paenibacillus sp. CF384 TaxID=1884382 RepID=UPI000895893A|nr:thioesterase family protein [Paenibacillus sp. CF384]SDX19568.1 acyl-CoA thioester hydrolase [Paenibacillus sp. CF384]
MTEADKENILWHLHPLRVRYQETDQMGVVFHGNYVTWFEIGRTELVRALGMTYETVEKQGLLLPVVDLDCSYVSPARYDNNVIICTRLEQFSPIRVSFRSEIRLVEDTDHISLGWFQGNEPPGKLLVRGGTRHVWVNRDWRPSRLDKLLPALYSMMQAVADGVVPHKEEGGC